MKRAQEAETEDLLSLGTTTHYEDAPLYDFEYRDQTEDLEWYVTLSAERAERGTIVELGAGTGRITVPLAQDGRHVIAIDRMPSMLEELQVKLRSEGLTTVEPLEADMTGLPLDDECANLVIAPFNALMHLYTWRELLACFQEARRVLVPGGTFAFDVLMPDLEWLQWDPEERHGVTYFKHPTTGRKLVYSTNHTYDPHTQVCHIRIYYDEPPRRRSRVFRPTKPPVKVVHLAHRQIFPEEIRALLDRAGLEIESHAGDFLGLTLTSEVESQVVVCRRPD